jgi:oligopeptide/dipeptide ABC transporter ATP-binding protein
MKPAHPFLVTLSLLFAALLLSVGVGSVFIPPDILIKIIIAQISGQPPSLISPPRGCHFRPRCPHAFSRCVDIPDLEQRGGSPGHRDRCWLTGEQKKTLRVLDSGDIGLEMPAA